MDPHRAKAHFPQADNYRKRDTCLSPKSQSLIETRVLGGLSAFESLYRNLIGIRMDIQARIGSVTSRIFCSRKHKSQSSSSYSSSKPYSPLRLFCSRRNYQEPRENDNNDNKGMHFSRCRMNFSICLNLVLLGFGVYGWSQN